MLDPFEDSDFCMEYEEWADNWDQFEKESRERSLEDEATRLDYFNRLETGV